MKRVLLAPRSVVGPGMKTEAVKCDPLMIIDMLIFSAEFMMQSEPRTVKS